MSTRAESHAAGPDLLDERSLGGVAVHLLGAAFGVFGAGLVYLVASHEYTRENARNALNWHVTVIVASVIAVAIFLLVILASPILEGLVGGSGAATVDAALGALGLVAFALPGLLWFVSLVLALVATGKAIFGTPWTYPGAYEFVGPDWTSPLSPDADAAVADRVHRLLLLAYAVLVPLDMVPGTVMALTESSSALFLVVFVARLLVTLFTIPVLFALYRDGTARERAGADWTPTWWLYVALPLLVGPTVYVARDAMGSMNPVGDAMLAVFVALWAASVVYLLQHRRHVGRS